MYGLFQKLHSFGMLSNKINKCSFFIIVDIFPFLFNGAGKLFGSPIVPIETGYPPLSTLTLVPGGKSLLVILFTFVENS